MGMEVLHIEREEVSPEFSANSTEDSDTDNGEQLDEDMNQNINVIKDVVKEVCMDNPTDIVKDIQTLSNVVSDGVKGRLSALHSTLSETSTTQNKCNKYSPVLKLSDGKIIRKTTTIWLFQEGEHVSSYRLFRVRAKQPFSSETRTNISEKPPVK